MFCVVQAVVNCILVTANCASLLRWLVYLTCWASARALEPLSCTSTKAVSLSMPSTAVWRECATVHPLRVYPSAVRMQVSGVQHWVSCGVVQFGAHLPWHCVSAMCFMNEVFCLTGVPQLQVLLLHNSFPMWWVVW